MDLLVGRLYDEMGRLTAVKVALVIKVCAVSIGYLGCSSLLFRFLHPRITFPICKFRYIDQVINLMGILGRCCMPFQCFVP